MFFVVLIARFSLVICHHTAAVNYAMTRTFPPEPSYHLLYDLGAASLRCTLVSLKSALLPDPYSLAAKPELKNVTSVNVHGVGFDVEVGGYQFDRLVRDLMIEQIEDDGGKGGKREAVKSNKRAMAKLLKEAGRVKQVLSANTEAMARVSGKRTRRNRLLGKYDGSQPDSLGPARSKV